MGKPKTDVVLTEEARSLLGADSVAALLRDGRYFNSSKVKQDGAFLWLTLTAPMPSGEPVDVDIAIPAHYVLYMISAGLQERLAGFKR